MDITPCMVNLILFFLSLIVILFYMIKRIRICKFKEKSKTTKNIFLIIVKDIYSFVRGIIKSIVIIAGVGFFFIKTGQYIDPNLLIVAKNRISIDLLIIIVLYLVFVIIVFNLTDNLNFKRYRKGQE